jgi:hypothetical protein
MGLAEGQGIKLNATAEQQEADKRKKLIDEIYGYVENETQEEKEKKSQIQELFNAYVQHRKEKQQNPLKTMMG